jgi:1-acyl-sn-glycerol-3-phosphate acyltransferase
VIRFTLRIAAILLGLLACLPLHYLWRLFGQRSPWPRRFLAWVGRVAGLRIRVEGVPLRSNALILANHASWLDIMVIAGTSGAAFVSKAEVKKWPAIGWLAGLHDTVFIERAARTAVRGQAGALRDALSTGLAVALFPEGTTEGGREVLPFRASLLSALYPILPGIRVQPVAIDLGAATEEIAWVGDEGAGANARRLLSRKGIIPVSVRFLDPLDPADFPDRKALAARARDEIVSALGAPRLPLAQSAADR